MDLQFDSLAFRLMKYRYGVGILFVLLEREKAYQNEIRKMLGSEVQPIVNSLAFLLAEGLIHEKPFPAGSRIKSEFLLTAKGRRIAVVLRKCADELEELSQNPGSSRP